MHDFDPTLYAPEVAGIFALSENGQRLMPLTCRDGSQEVPDILMRAGPADLFPESPDPAAAMAGLWLYFSCFEKAHDLVSKSETRECELWHAILHRQEPDADNAAYWFRKVGKHRVFSKIAQAATRILAWFPPAAFRVEPWDPFAFIAFCERARLQPGSVDEQAALEIQRAEWQILFDYCARPPQ
jgi:hypothetical protein